MDGPRTLWCCSGSEDIWKKSCIHKGMLMYDMKAARVLWAEAFHRWKLVPPEGDTIHMITRPTSMATCCFQAALLVFPSCMGLISVTPRGAYR